MIKYDKVYIIYNKKLYSPIFAPPLLRIKTRIKIAYKNYAIYNILAVFVNSNRGRITQILVFTRRDNI